MFAVHPPHQGRPWPQARPVPLTFRIEPGLKEALRAAAEREMYSNARVVAPLNAFRLRTCRPDILARWQRSGMTLRGLTPREWRRLRKDSAAKAAA